MEGEVSAFRLAQLETLVKGYQVEIDALKSENSLTDRQLDITLRLLQRTKEALKWTLALLQMQRSLIGKNKAIIEFKAFDEYRTAEAIIEEASAVLKLLSATAE